MDHLEPISFSIVNYGCKVNTYDGGLLESRLKKDGFSPSDKPRVYIVNTCAVTAEATKEAIRQVRKIKKLNPDSIVAVTGCGAQVDTDKYAELKEADLVVANSHKGRLETLVRQFLAGKQLEKTHKDNIFRKLDLEEGGGLESSHTRSFLKIQDGCNSFCTYCVIPFARGRSRSLSIDSLVERVNELHSQNFQEVVLTGIHIGDYEDSGKVLEDLIESILMRTNMPRIRLTSLEPVEIGDRLLELFKNEKMCKHFHMSIQSAQNAVLKNMKRKYGSAEVESALTSIAKKVPGSFIGMDVIVGFPGETPEQYQETKSRLEGLPWTKIHVFPYSERPGTKALTLPDKVSGSEIARRSADLRGLSLERYAKCALEQIGSIKDVLVLKDGLALSRDFWKVQIPGSVASESPEIKVKISGYDHSNFSAIEGALVGVQDY
ncbi:MAG: tRNA (N(6)-L-threonylcarbamoyladenosine(37)-C(2))-methylthiotransferase MtaB [Proteobacteria bacterium SG_bin7]|nr:MAG: tRNA (N(6)-L-threonylcarbamoyladenosine(37)-C(2))-methylthiotransferase MtaB [Proteobacteria bacterium SG_bin7]